MSWLDQWLIRGSDRAGSRLCSACCGSGGCSALASTSESPPALQGTGPYRVQSPKSSYVCSYSVLSWKTVYFYACSCACIGGDTLPQIQLVGCFGGAGKLEVHLSLFFRIYIRQGVIHTLSVCLFGTLKGAKKAGWLSFAKFCVWSFITFTRLCQQLQVCLQESVLHLKNKIVHFSFLFLV